MARMIDSAEAEPTLAKVVANNAAAKRTDVRDAIFMMYSMFHAIAPNNWIVRSISRFRSEAGNQSIVYRAPRVKTTFS